MTRGMTRGMTRDKSLILLRVEIRNDGNFGRNMKIEDIEETILVECLLHWEKRLKRHDHICASVCMCQGGRWQVGPA